MKSSYGLVSLLVLLIAGLARAETIANFPESLRHEHHSWHMNHNPSAAGAGVEFLRFHRDFVDRALAWYRAQPGANLNAVADTWRAIPSELKQFAYGWSTSLATAEQRVASGQPPFASEDELGRFIELNLHNWLHGASASAYGQPRLNDPAWAPTSTYFYKIHGLVDYWWSLYRGYYDVGVIPQSSCPTSFQTATLHMDNEDRNQQSRVTPWVGATTVDSNANTAFTFCRVNGTQFRSLASSSTGRANYALLKLGKHCPPGSVEFSRFFDNEDNDNRNSTNWHMYPNVVDRNTRLYFCLFRGGGSVAQSLPQLGFEYGLFAGNSFGFTSARGSIYTDDEDNNNVNGYSAASAWKSDATAIVTEGANTTLYTAKAAFPYCGDRVCNGIETVSTCASDCAFCGDGTCNGSETASTCRTDCGYCGDGYCGARENSSSCSIDCGGGNCIMGDPSETDSGLGPQRLPICMM